MSLKYLRNLVVSLAVLSVVALVSFRAGQKSNEFTAFPEGQFDLSLMWRVKDKLSSVYLEKKDIDGKKMKYGAIQGMVASLGDPYTVFLPPVENKSSNEDLAGSFGGVGISLGYKDKSLAVMTPLSKTPADKAGVLSGDLILRITDKDRNIDRDTAGISLSEAVELIRGKVGTKVTLKLFREGKDAPFDVVLERDNIVVPSLELEWVDSAKASTTEKDKFGGKKIAWVKLYKFSEQLYKEWPRIVDEIVSKHSTEQNNYGGIVLDLRNNPGGFLQGSVVVGSDFISEGVIVKQESSDGRVETYTVDPSRRKLLNDKLVVLVNGGSASASEILAGALKDRNRAKLVGEKTFGKGTVQEPLDFSDGSGLHVTIAKWLLPSGKNIHKEGVEPDVQIKFEATADKDSKKDNQLDKAIETLLSL